MSSSFQQAELFSFEDNSSLLLESVILNLLNSSLQPSAEELLSICEKECGLSARESLKETLLRLIEDTNLSEYKKEYLNHILLDRSIDKAIAGSLDSHGRREINTGIDNLISMSKDYRYSKDFQEMICFMGQFRDYAPYNNMLVRIQNPSCGFYATAADWKHRFERTIIEDARPMLILAPMHPVMLVYDVDSTEGKPLPAELTNFSKFEGKWEPKWLEKLIENADRYKIRVEFKALSLSNSGFATHAKRGSEWKMRIVIHNGIDEPSRFGVLCHELAHIFLGHLGGDQDLWWPSRFNLDHHSMEIEAEATAFIVTQQLGLCGSSPAYVSAHLKDSDFLPSGVSVDNIAKVSGKIEQMAKGLLPEPKYKKDKKEHKG
ncbi:MAG: hypothetical protein CTY19_05800 [Methylomonas sp.]|nr:MAG: hypothetical protein CTY19_05800 [Methylomonas sp.]